MKNPNIKKTPVTLLIMDGFGLAQPGPGNAIHLANTPELDALIEKHPHTALSASGKDAGLPEGTMGNSEVGHTNIGAGRVVYQELTRISKAIDDGDFFKNPVLLSAMDNAKKPGAALHLMGLLSDGGVHSHYEHLYALLDMAKKAASKMCLCMPCWTGAMCPPLPASAISVSSSKSCGRPE